MAEWRLTTIPGLTGLRAYAVVAVVLAHARVAGFRGGGIGVDVFFTLSGFLITGLLVGELDRTERVDLVRFWKRRAFRLLPALAVFLVVWVPLAHTIRTDRSDAWPVAFYYANWYKAFGGDIGGFAHTWSLAVEEQFYLVWPLALLGLAAIDRTLRTATWFSIGAAVGIVTLRVAFVIDGMERVRWYNDGLLRADGIMLGCALALWLHTRGLPRWTFERSSVWGGGAILLAAMVARGNNPPEVLMTLVPAFAAIGAALVIGGIVGCESSMPAFSHAVAIWLGERSYAIYLWHFPLLITDLVPAGGQNVVWRIALTLAAAELSYRFVEAPALGLRDRRRVGRRSMAAAT